MVFRKYILGLLIIAGVLLPVSCDDALNSCREQYKRGFIVGFYTWHIKSTSYVAVDTLLDSVSVYGIGREDSLIYRNYDDISRIYLPLSQKKDTVAYVIKYKKAAGELNCDTLTIIYKRETTFMSYKCGYYTNFRVDTAYNTMKYDTLRLINNYISDERLEAYRIVVHNRLYTQP